MKRCSICREEKRLDQFYKDAPRKDGLHPLCKQCSARKTAAYYRKNKARLNAKWREDYAKNPRKILARNERWAKSSPFTRKFHDLKGRARKRGIEFTVTLLEHKVLAQQPCFVIGCQEKVTGLDRIDSEGVYSTDNVRSSCWPHNNMKGTQTDAEFYSRCKQVVTWYESKEAA